jgi:hypothetical protein
MFLKPWRPEKYKEMALYHSAHHGKGTNSIVTSNLAIFHLLITSPSYSQPHSQNASLKPTPQQI